MPKVKLPTACNREVFLKHLLRFPSAEERSTVHPRKHNSHFAIVTFFIKRGAKGEQNIARLSLEDGHIWYEIYE